MGPVAVVITTGVANTASVVSGLRRCGVESELSADAARVRDASLVVLPGVGSFGAGMARLRESGLDDALRDRIDRGRPLLAVCLGLQLLCAASEESPGVGGLGVVRASVSRFGEGVRVPQFGWNRVEADAGCRLLEDGYAYFANSYRLIGPPAGAAVAWAGHGGRFVAAFEMGSVLACQFHPELSGPWGLGLIRRWASAGADIQLQTEVERC